MVSPRERARPARRRIAGERSRTAGTRPEQDRAPDEAPVRDEAPPPTARPEEAVPDAVPPATARPGASATAAEPATTAVPEEPAHERATTGAAQAPAGDADRDSGPPSWLLAVLAGLLVGALALDGFLLWNKQHTEEESARALHSALIEAPSVAERAAKDLLSFRHDTLDKDVAQARQYLTQGYRPDYIASIKKVVAAPAKDVGAVVEADVLASGVVDASGERSDVLLFVNQATTSSTSAEPQTALNRVVFTMVRRDGQWMVHEIQAL